MSVCVEMLEDVLVAAWIIECVGIIVTVANGNMAGGSPLSPSTAVLALVGAVVFFIWVVQAGKFVARRSGPTLSRCLPGDPLANPRTIRKFADQFWQLLVHAGFTILELYILQVHDGGKPWAHDAYSMWGGARSVSELWRISYDAPLHVLYLLQAAVWIATCFSHVCLEVRRRDFAMMLAHHVVTIGLVWLSYTLNFVAVGVVIMFIHDASDVFIDLMKLSNYLQLEGPRGFFLVETCYVANLFSWTYLRLNVLPVHVIWRTIVVASREIATAPGAPGMESFTKASGGNAYGRGHAPGFLVCCGSCVANPPWPMASVTAIAVHCACSLALLQPRHVLPGEPSAS